MWQRSGLFREHSRILNIEFKVKSFRISQDDFHILCNFLNCGYKINFKENVVLANFPQSLLYPLYKFYANNCINLIRQFVQDQIKRLKCITNKIYHILWKILNKI